MTSPRVVERVDNVAADFIASKDTVIPFLVRFCYKQQVLFTYFRHKLTNNKILTHSPIWKPDTSAYAVYVDGAVNFDWVTKIILNNLNDLNSELRINIRTYVRAILTDGDFSC